MTLNTKKSYMLSVKRARRRHRPARTSSSSSLFGTCSSRGCRTQRSFKHIGFEGNNSKLSHKLKALKKLIPAAQAGGKIVKVDQLFQETADYILLLRTRVAILQKLVEIYGNSSENQNSVS